MVVCDKCGGNTVSCDCPRYENYQQPFRLPSGRWVTLHRRRRIN